MKLSKIIKDYRLSNNLTMDEFAKLAGVSKAYISMLEKNKNSTSGRPIKPSLDTLKNIATAMSLSLDNFLNMLDDNTTISLEKINKSQPTLTRKDERDIQKRLQSILDDLNSDAALSFYNGDQEMDDETKELLKVSLEQSIRTAKIRAKEKFTPNKYKK